MTPLRRPVLIGVNSLGMWVNLASGTTRLLPWRLVWHTFRPALLFLGGWGIVLLIAYYIAVLGPVDPLG